MIHPAFEKHNSIKAITSALEKNKSPLASVAKKRLTSNTKTVNYDTDTEPLKKN